jgi:hypothetical protein
MYFADWKKPTRNNKRLLSLVGWVLDDCTNERLPLTLDLADIELAALDQVVNEARVADRAHDDGA